jgi:hypothetical protein
MCEKAVTQFVSKKFKQLAPNITEYERSLKNNCTDTLSTTDTIGDI